MSIQKGQDGRLIMSSETNSALPAYITKKNKQEGAMCFERRNQNLGSRVDGAQAVGAAVFPIDPCG
ncbi:hypothetical protein D3C81_2005040 [compost metagenome]